jgi:hypothetical protein
MLVTAFFLPFVFADFPRLQKTSPYLDIAEPIQAEQPIAFDRELIDPTGIDIEDYQSDIPTEKVLRLYHGDDEEEDEDYSSASDPKFSRKYGSQDIDPKSDWSKPENIPKKYRGSLSRPPFMEMFGGSDRPERKKKKSPSKAPPTFFFNDLETKSDGPETKSAYRYYPQTYSDHTKFMTRTATGAAALSAGLLAKRLTRAQNVDRLQQYCVGMTKQSNANICNKEILTKLAPAASVLASSWLAGTLARSYTRKLAQNALRYEAARTADQRPTYKLNEFGVPA